MERKVNRGRALLVVTAAGLLVANTAFAEGERIVVKAGPSPAPEASRYLADIAKPTSLKLKKGDDLRSFVSKLCGSVTDSYVDILKSRNQGITYPVLSSPSVVEFPACLNVSQNKTVLVSAGDSVSSIAQKHMGVEGPKSIAAILGNNPDLFGCKNSSRMMNPQAASKCAQIHPGDKITVPYSSAPVVYSLKENLPEGNVAAKNKLDALIRNGVTHGSDSAGVSGPPQETLVMPIELQASPQSGPACDKPENSDVFQVSALLKVLAVNDATRMARSIDFTPATIAIADSGIDSFGTKAFPRNTFDVIQGSFGGGAGTDLVYGRDVQDPSRAPIAYKAYAASAHGTHVAGLARGGPAFWGTYIGQPAGPAPRVKLLIINMVRRIATAASETFDTPAGSIVNAAAYAHDRHAAVLNVSYTATALLPTLIQVLHDDPHLLIVGAAGNDSADLDDGRDIFPGNYGGTSGLVRDQVITVAAHDKDYNLTWFSAFGKQSVDIAAPGCGVLSDGPNGSEIVFSGTSQATPLVSFAAGLLSSEGIQSAREIKARLVSSVDLRDSMRSRVAWGGSLNIVKALSVYQDVIQLAPGASTGGMPDADPSLGALVFGTIHEPDDGLLKCGNTDIHLTGVYKISPKRSQRDQSAKARVIKKGPQGGPRDPDECELTTDGVDMEVVSGESTTVKHFKWTEVSDVVLRWFR